MPQENAILIGKKPPMNYVLACLTAFHEGADDVLIKARGRSISMAVEVAEIVKNKFMPSVLVKDVSIGTDEVPLKEGGGNKRASSITIRLSKKK
jgi:DNA-binding protein Alba